MEKNYMFDIDRYISKIGFGGIPIQKLSQEDAVNVLIHAFNSGINFIDTARGYSVSESYVGQALKVLPRNEIILATKCPSLDYENMKKGIETSLSTLDVDYIDLYQVHNIPNLPALQKAIENGTFEALKEAQKEGKILNVGITSHVMEVLDYAIDTIPNEFSSIMYPYNIIETQGTELFKKAYDNKKSVIVMKPICGGNLSDINLFSQEIKEKISKLNITLGQLALRFITQNPHVTTVIPGMATLDEINQNCSISYAPLSLEEEELFVLLRQSLDNSICRRCNYCAPCPQGIDIPTMFTLQNYLKNYDLADWANSRFSSNPKNASACQKCGVCESRCPYNIPIRDKLQSVSKDFDNYDKSKT